MTLVPASGSRAAMALVAEGKADASINTLVDARCQRSINLIIASELPVVAACSCGAGYESRCVGAVFNLR